MLWSANGQHVLESTYQLPQTTKPLEYWLEINPNMMAKTFVGDVKIKISANADTNQIILHSKDLNIVKAVVTNLVEDKIIESSYSLDDHNDTLIITLVDGEQLLAGNKYKVKITFAGVLSKNNPFGFVLYWRTKYERERGKEDA